MLRQLIVAFVGHVDHGKTSLQDNIRGTAVVLAEPGAITQCISCTKISSETINKICKDLSVNKIKIPGFLFLDTPGHASFTNLRKRGGSLADMAVLVIDINEGIKPQTIESIEILKQNKTPFIIAANKIDLLSGWKKTKEKGLINNIKAQSENTQNLLDKKIYELVGEIYKHGFNAERFDRIEDYTKQIAIIPTSAKTGDGIPELLMVLMGLAQKFLEQDLQIDIKKPAKAVILEVKEQKGLGTFLDTIVYDGTLKVNDTIVIGGITKPIVTKVRNLFEPTGQIKKVSAASTIKILAPDIKEAISGMPLRVANTQLEKIKKEVQEEVHEVIIETDQEGVIIKADSLGSLEALTNLLKEKNITIKRASIGEISKKDITESQSQKDPLKKVILGFNIVPIKTDVKVICHDVIYKIIEDFEKWQEETKKDIEKTEIDSLTRPCKFRIMPHYIFRQSHPAVVGVDLMTGILKTNTPLIKENGNKIGIAKSIQSEGENINEVKAPAEIAVSLPGVTVGRQVHENDILYSDIPEKDFIKLKKLKRFLNKEEIETLKEIADIKRKQDPLWGI